MLLSTDWFFEYWYRRNIQAEEPVKSKLQRRCRKVVEEMMAGLSSDSEPSHYLIAFSKERLDGTSLLLKTAFEDSGFEIITQDTLRELKRLRESHFSTSSQLPAQPMRSFAATCKMVILNFRQRSSIFSGPLISVNF